MAFKFAARTLLELGKELISTDEVALYELIKNSIDAGSKLVEIEFNICLLHSHYEEALDALQKKRPLAAISVRLKEQILADAIIESRDALLGTLDAAESADAFELALKASYAANNWITVRDKGVGMSLEELDDVYLSSPGWL